MVAASSPTEGSEPSARRATPQCPNRSAGQALSSAHRQPRQRPPVLGAEGDQHHRRDVRDDGEEVGEHRLAHLVDPVHILDEVERRFGAGQRRGVDQCGQPAPPGIRVDFGQCTSGSATPSRSSSSTRSSGSASGNLSPHPARAAGLRGRPCRSPPAAAASPHGTECRWRGTRRRPKTPRPRDRPRAPRPPEPSGSCRCPAAHHVDDTAAAGSRGPPWRRGPPSPSADRPGSTRCARPGHAAGRPPAADAPERVCRSLDRTSSVLPGPRRARPNVRSTRQHHPARRGDRLHPLRQPDLLTDRA